VPNSLIKKISQVQIFFSNIGITQLTNPFLSSQLSGLTQVFEITDRQISKIDANVFDNLPRLSTLGIAANIDDNTLNSGCV
jgi:hypothetical protein